MRSQDKIGSFRNEAFQSEKTFIIDQLNQMLHALLESTHTCQPKPLALTCLG